MLLLSQELFPSSAFYLFSPGWPFNCGLCLQLHHEVVWLLFSLLCFLPFTCSLNSTYLHFNLNFFSPKRLSLPLANMTSSSKFQLLNHTQGSISFTSPIPARCSSSTFSWCCDLNSTSIFPHQNFLFAYLSLPKVTPLVPGESPWIPEWYHRKHAFGK